MKNLIFLFSIILLAVACNPGADGGSAVGASEGKAVLVSQMDSMCYAVGASFSKSVKGNQMNLTGEQVRKGYMECKKGNSFINEQNSRDITSRLQMQFRQQQGTATDSAAINMDSLSYAIGGSYYFQLASLGIGLNDEALVQGIEDNLQEGTGKLDDQQVRSLLDNFRVVAEKAQNEKNAADAVVNIAKGEAFLAEKAKETGVKSTPSGLHYKVLKAGSGAKPKVTDKVSVHYEGRLIDGTVFDSSIKKGTPVEFGLNGVIKGWTEGLQLMKTGAKYQFYIPSDLAYGNRGSGPKIGAGETLIFDVELLEIK